MAIGNAIGILLLLLLRAGASVWITIENWNGVPDVKGVDSHLFKYAEPLHKRRKTSDSDDTSDTCSETSTAEDDNIFGDVHMLVPTFLAHTVPQEDYLYTYKTQEQLYVQTLRGMLYSGDGPPNRDGGIERATIHSALRGAEKRLLSIAAYPGQSAYAQKLETARTLKEQPTPPDTWLFTHSMIVQEILFYLQSLAKLAKRDQPIHCNL